METIFDPEHNMTAEEKKDIFGIISKERWFEDIKDADSNNAALYNLYFYRGDEVTAARYLNKIKNPKTRFELTYADIIE